MRSAAYVALVMLATFSGVSVARDAGSALNAESFPGGDVGAQINAAVAACPSAPSVGCAITVQRGGTISTPPNLPIGTTLIFNPMDVFTLSTNWVLAHRGVTVYFNNATIRYTLDNGTAAFYVGKNIASTVSISGTTVKWRGGAQFTNVDPGDQIQWSPDGHTVFEANIAKLDSPTALTLTAAVDKPVASAAAVVLLTTDTGLGPNPVSNVSLHDLNIVGIVREKDPADVGLRLELVSNVTVRGVTVTNMGAGTCLSLRGVIASSFYDVRCHEDGSGIIFDANTLGGFITSGSAANRIFGADLESSGWSSGSALVVKNQSGYNAVYGAHVEGNGNDAPGVVQDSSGNSINLLDWERNGTRATSADLRIENAPNTTVYGPAQFQSYVSPTGILVRGSPRVRGSRPTNQNRNDTVA